MSSPLNFSSVQQEINYYLNHIARGFMGGFSGSGENGIDVTLPQDTPIYAVEGGTVVGSGYYQGGGVVSIESAPGKVWYYQHNDLNLVSAGQKINPGQEIALSGGQNTGGYHPASPEFSSWPHLEIGIDAPWSGIWGGGPAVGPNINPVPDLQALSGDTTATAGAGALAKFGAQAQVAAGNQVLSGTTGGAAVSDPTTWIPAIVNGIEQSLGVPSLTDILWRAGFIIVGAILFIVGMIILDVVHVEQVAGIVAPIAGKAAASGA